jgi:alcohol dehydrogenase
VLDILPPSAPTTAVRAAIMTVRRNGRVALMGGVGMLGGAGLELPYPWLMQECISIHGAWMYPRQAIPRLIALVRTGLLDLGQFELSEFPLARANDAVAHAAANGGAFRMTVLKL